MRRIRAFLTWHSKWWMERAQCDWQADEGTREGLQAHALHQAKLKAELCASFGAKWASGGYLKGSGRNLQPEVCSRWTICGKCFAGQWAGIGDCGIVFIIHGDRRGQLERSIYGGQ